MTIQEMITDLIKAGHTHQSIADGIQTSQPNVTRMLGGGTVKYELGKRIELFHAKEMRKAARQGDRRSTGRGRRSTDPSASDVKAIKEIGEKAKSIAERLTA